MRPLARNEPTWNARTLSDWRLWRCSSRFNPGDRWLLFLRVFAPGLSLENYSMVSNRCMDDNDEIVRRLRRELPAILTDHPVLLAYLYGSWARAETTPLSDVDIALVTESALSPLDRLDLELDIEVALANCGVRAADVRVINQAPSVARGRVVTEGILLYCRDEQARDAFESEARLSYRVAQPDLRAQWRTYVQSAVADLRQRDLYGR